MKLYIINNARMPTEKAHGYQIAKMCESFSLSGLDLELIVPKRVNSIDESIFDYYEIKSNFKVKYLSSFDFFKLENIIGSRLSFYLQSWAFKMKVSSLKIDKEAIVISRNPEIVQACVKKNIKTFYDAHRWPESKNTIFKRMLRGCNGIICNSAGTAKAFLDNGFDNILIAPNGVDLKEYEIEVNRDETRNKFNLPRDKKIIMYVGHLYDWKGVDVVMETARLNKDNQNVFVFVGGTKKDIEKYQAKAKDSKIRNIIFLGHQKKNIIPALQKSADILLLPNIAINKESLRYTSPIKMFEYMASGVLIISSDLPSIREVLNDRNAVLFKAGDAKSLNNKLALFNNGKINSEKIVQQAKKDVQGYSWIKRVKKIIDFIKI